MTIQEAIRKIVDRQDLSFDESHETMRSIMTGAATPAQISCIITALRMKKETPDEIAGFARAMQELAADLGVDGKDFIDTCGTGGDHNNTFNISTAAAFVAAGAGAKIAKHGNKSVSSQCGSADVLSACGVNINAPAEKVSQALREIGIAFLFAPLMHSAMKHAIGPRKEIAIRTIFNVLGPLTNPLKTRRQLIGVYEPGLVDTIAAVLKNLGAEKACVVHGLEGLDEISVSGKTKIAFLDGQRITVSEVQPQDLGIAQHPLDAIRGGTAQDNAGTMKALLEGKMKGSAIEDVCLLNAAFAVYVAGLAESPRAGAAKARESLSSGKALQKLQALAAITNS